MEAPAQPLFSDAVPLVRHRLSGILKPSKNGPQWKVPNSVHSLADAFNFPFLSELIHRYFSFGRIVTSAKAGFLPLELRSCLNITTESFQSESLETLKARCGPPSQLQPLTCNEDVFYDDEPNSYGRFGQYAIGKLLCLFVVWIPGDKTQWPYVDRISIKSFRLLQTHRLALIRTYQYDNNGDMFPGPGLGRVRYNRDPSKQYHLIDIEKVLRPAMLLPDHFKSQHHEPAMAWWVNNRIDDTTWHMFYDEESVR